MGKSNAEIVNLSGIDYTYQYDTKKDTYVYTEKIYISEYSSYYTVTFPRVEDNNTYIANENTYIHIHVDRSGGGRVETNVPKILERVGTNAIIISPSADYKTDNWGKMWDFFWKGFFFWKEWRNW